MSKIIDNYVLVKSLNNLGEFGEIHRAKHLITSEIVTIKVLKIDKFIEDNQIRDMILNEIKVLKNIQTCERVLRIHKMLKSNNHIYIVYDYCEDGSLQDKIDSGKNLSENEVKSIIIKVLESYQLLNKQDIIHCNINAKCLQFKNDKILFSDFVFCRDTKNQKNNQNIIFTEKILNFLPYKYKSTIAPELLKQQQPVVKSDIYSLGMVFYDLIFHVQIDNNRTNRIIDFETQGVNVSLATRNLLKSMIHEEINMRPSLEVILKTMETLVIYENGQRKDKLQPGNYQEKDNSQDDFQVKENFQQIEKVKTNHHSPQKGIIDNNQKKIFENISPQILDDNTIKNINQMVLKERNKILFCSKMMNEIINLQLDQKQNALIVFLLLSYMKKLNNQILFVLDGESNTILQHIPNFKNLFKGDFSLLTTYKEHKQSSLLYNLLNEEGEQIFQLYRSAKQTLTPYFDSVQNIQLKNIVDDDTFDQHFMNKQLLEYIEVVTQRAHEIREQDEYECKKHLIHANFVCDVIELEKVFEKNVKKDIVDLSKQDYFESIQLQNIERLKLLIKDRLIQLAPNDRKNNYQSQNYDSYKDNIY